MVKVLLTVDTELWPLDRHMLWSPQWELDHAAICSSFDTHIRGRTAEGDFGVCYLLERFRHFGCRAVFFVEPLFSRETDAALLREIVDLVLSAGQDVELHLHAEWNEKGRHPLIPFNRGRNMRDYTLEEQTELIRAGVDLLRHAGADNVTAFRAGGYAGDAQTLQAIRGAGIAFDSSINGSVYNSGDPELRSVARRHSFIRVQDSVELPVTVFEDRPGHWRHTQLGACSARELSHLLEQAWKQRCDYFVIVLHGTELLTADRTRADPTMLRRFDSLLGFLQANRHRFETVSFRDALRTLADDRPASHPHRLATPLWMTGMRVVEQALRRSPFVVA